MVARLGFEPRSPGLLLMACCLAATGPKPGILGPSRSDPAGLAARRPGFSILYVLRFVLNIIWVFDIVCVMVDISGFHNHMSG